MKKRSIIKKSSKIQLKTNNKLLTDFLQDGKENPLDNSSKHVKINSQQNLNFLPDIDEDYEERIYEDN